MDQKDRRACLDFRNNCHQARLNWGGGPLADPSDAVFAMVGRLGDREPERDIGYAMLRKIPQACLDNLRLTIRDDFIVNAVQRGPAESRTPLAP